MESLDIAAGDAGPGPVQGPQWHVDFSKKCMYCKQILCDGLTLTSFINSRINYEGADEAEAAHSFMNAYLLLKYYELFQGTRFTDPEVVYKFKSLPMCIKDAFQENYLTGTPCFDQYRKGKRIKSCEK